jgi:hypothetical protein
LFLPFGPLVLPQILVRPVLPAPVGWRLALADDQQIDRMAAAGCVFAHKGESLP